MHTIGAITVPLKKVTGSGSATAHTVICETFLGAALNHTSQQAAATRGCYIRGTECWEILGGVTTLLHRFAWNSPKEIPLAKHYV